jgi:hypothetical protein
VRNLSGNGEALGLVIPFLLWGAGFALLYAVHGFACGVGVRAAHYDGFTRAALAFIYLALLAGHAVIAWKYWRRWRSPEGAQLRFVRLVSLILAITAFAASMWTGFPAVSLSICS